MCPVINNADPEFAPDDDILGKRRLFRKDVGAFELRNLP